MVALTEPPSAARTSEPSTIGVGRAKPARRADIQGLRAVAVGLVVAYHAGLPIPGGFIGVDVFFVVSGFVIAPMLFTQLRGSGGVRMGTFVTRRVRRLLPALALMSTVTALLAMVVLSPLGPQQQTGRTGIAASLFVANVQLARVDSGYFALASESNAFLHTWSLSVEEQFYLFLPLALVAAWALARRQPGPLGDRPRIVVMLVVFGTLGSFAVSKFTTGAAIPVLGDGFAFYSSITRAWEFGVGVLLALFASSFARIGRWPAQFAGLAGVVLLGYGALTISAATPWPGSAALIPVVATALILVAGLQPGGLVGRSLSQRQLVQIGDLSYGWYLWHWPILAFVAALWPGDATLALVAAVGALVPAWLSYRFLEGPIRTDDRIVGRRAVLLFAVCVAVPLTACAGLLLVNRVQRSTAVVETLAEDIRVPGRAAASCAIEDLGTSAGDRCPWALPDPAGSVVLVGDSQATQFSEALAGAANAEGYDFTFAAKNACPFVSMEYRGAWRGDGQLVELCRSFVDETMADLVANPPDLVVLATAGSMYVNLDGQLGDPGAAVPPAATPSARAARWAEGTGVIIDRLNAAGIPVAVVHPIPHLAGQSEWSAGECSTVRLFTSSCTDRTVTRTEVEAQQGPARDAEDAAVAASDAAVAIDFTDDLCGPRTCSSSRDGVRTYRDGTHVTVAAAERLGDRFRDLITDHAASAGR